MTTAVVDQSRVRELKKALVSKGEEIKNLSGSWKTEEGGQFVISGDEQKSYLKAVNEAEEIRQLIVAEKQAGGIFEFLAADEGKSYAGSDAAEGHRGGGEMKSVSAEFLGSDFYVEAKARGFKGQPLMGGFSVERGLPDLAFASQKDVYSAMGGTVAIPGLGTAQNLGLTERMLRPGRVRDMFPAERTNAAMLYGMRETGYTNRARVVAERTAADGTAATGGATDVYGLKPKSELTILPVTYPIATIAHIMYVHKNVLDDEPRMRGLLDRDMVDGVKMAEDDQILWGDGVGDNLTGLMNTSGVQEYDGLATDRLTAQVRRAATRSILAYFQPNGVVVHPLDWEAMELETDKNGAYTVAVSVAVGGQKQIWRLKVTDTPAMNEGMGLVGSFGTGAKLYDREQVNVQISTENRDMFERNAYTLRAEERLGLVVDRPESFVAVNFTPFVPA
jgi:HK97 family phage major capsid protein